MANSESGSGLPAPWPESVWGCLQHRWGDGGWEGRSGWVWQYGVMVVVKRPKVKGGLCSAVRVAAWAPILLSLYFGQISVSLLEESTNVELSDYTVKYNSTETGKTTQKQVLPPPVPWWVAGWHLVAAAAGLWLFGLVLQSSSPFCQSPPARDRMTSSHLINATRKKKTNIPDTPNCYNSPRLLLSVTTDCYSLSGHRRCRLLVRAPPGSDQETAGPGWWRIRKFHMLTKWPVMTLISNAYIWVNRAFLPYKDHQPPFASHSLLSPAWTESQWAEFSAGIKTHTLST